MLNFLKELPDRYLVFFCFLILIGFYYFVQTDAILQLMINFGVAIIALAKRPERSANEMNTENIERVTITPSNNLNNLTDAEINKAVEKIEE